MNTTNTIFDPVEALAGDPEAQIGFLAAAFESDDPAHIRRALGIAARARGITEVANAVGMTRQGLGKALGENGNPTLDTLVGVAKALGVHISVKVAA